MKWELASCSSRSRRPYRSVTPAFQVWLLSPSSACVSRNTQSGETLRSYCWALKWSLNLDQALLWQCRLVPGGTVWEHQEGLSRSSRHPDEPHGGTLLLRRAARGRREGAVGSSIRAGCLRSSQVPAKGPWGKGHFGHSLASLKGSR